MLQKTNQTLLLNACLNVCQQLQYVLEEIENEIYSQKLRVLSDSSIGQHVRHVLEFYKCLIDCKDSEKLNYDRRERNKNVEENKVEAIKLINWIIENIKELNVNLNINLESNYSLDSDNNTTAISSIGRELAYNIEHAIHHMALIKIGLIDTKSAINLPEDFGIASSTIRYREQLQCAQ